MKIAHLITRLIRGGADENTVLTVEGLCRAGEDVTLIIGKGHEQEILDRVRGAGAKVKIVPLRHFSFLSGLITIIPLARYLKAQGFDIVHTHETEMGFVGRIAARLAGVKRIVHTVHGVPFSPYRPLWMNALVQLLERACARLSTRIVTNSDSIREEYLRRGIGRREQYITIHSGIDLTAYARPMRTSSQARPTVTMIARLAKGKGHMDLLRAIDALKEAVPTVRCWIVGDGERRERLTESVARRGLNKHVTLLGHRNDIPSILAQTTVLALPSYWEGTPRSITEAMAAGIPVVATPVGGICEQVENGVNGYLVPVRNPRILAEKLQELLQDPELAHAMGAQGHVRARAFSKERMLAGIIKLYGSMTTSTTLK